MREERARELFQASTALANRPFLCEVPLAIARRFPGVAFGAAIAAIADGDEAAKRDFVRLPEEIQYMGCAYDASDTLFTLAVWSSCPEPRVSTVGAAASGVNDAALLAVATRAPAPLDALFNAVRRTTANAPTELARRRAAARLLVSLAVRACGDHRVRERMLESRSILVRELACGSGAAVRCLERIVEALALVSRAPAPTFTVPLTLSARAVVEPEVQGGAEGRRAHEAAAKALLSHVRTVLETLAATLNVPSLRPQRIGAFLGGRDRPEPKTTFTLPGFSTQKKKVRSSSSKGGVKKKRTRQATASKRVSDDDRDDVEDGADQWRGSGSNTAGDDYGRARSTRRSGGRKNYADDDVSEAIVESEEEEEEEEDAGSLAAMATQKMKREMLSVLSNLFDLPLPKTRGVRNEERLTARTTETIGTQPIYEAFYDWHSKQTQVIDL